MGVMDFLKGGKKDISSRTAVILTEAGKKEAENIQYAGRNFAILAVLQDHHVARTIGDIARETDIDVAEVKERVRVLARQGLVRLMSEYEVG